MKRAFQKDAAFLADIARARDVGRPYLWWLGQSGFLLYTKTASVVFDPYLSDSLTKKYANTDKPHTRITERVIGGGELRGIDIVTCSHNHTDHLDADTLLPMIAANPKVKLLIPRANRDLVVERLAGAKVSLIELVSSEHVTVSGVEFHGIPAAHNTVERDEHGRCRFLGYIARVEGLTIYHSGDTLMHDGLIPALAPFKPDVALLPINGSRPERRVVGNLDGREAAQLAQQIGARIAVPHHFDMFEFNTESPDEFTAECRRIGQNCRVLRNGEGMDL